MKRITTGDVARELRAIFPQATEAMVRRDAESGELATFPRFSNASWYYVDPEGLADYIERKGRGQIPQERIREVLIRLNANFKQAKLVLVS